MIFDLKRIIAALLFSTSEALSIREIQGVIGRYHTEVAERLEEGEENPIPALVTAAEIRLAIGEIEGELVEREEIYRLVEGHDGYRFVVVGEYGAWVRHLRGDPKPMQLSRAALETLAIVAYRQPVTRSEVESIRGVSADGALNRLLEHDLILVEGRAELPGRPMLYAVTERFLEFVGIRSIDELPSSDLLSPRRIDDWIRQAAGLEEELEAGENGTEVSGEGGTVEVEPVGAEIGEESVEKV